MGHELSVQDFQIAIICALRVECDAVEAIFDKFLEEDDELPMLNKAAWDTNIYTTGVIGHHNVVLAHMPDYGIGNSATVAANIRHTFPAVGVAFVVGICGGTPKIKDDDIMLGDVIISTEVIQYGLGRELPHEFRPIDTIGREPSSELKSYLNKMQGAREVWHLGDRTLRYLNAPRRADWQPKPKHPGIENDKLFVSTHRHKHHQKGVCETCDKCLNDKDPPCKESETLDCTILGCHEVVFRQRKSSSKQLEPADTKLIPESLKPQVHFGRFGSADRVMKSSTERDRLAKEFGIVALEMEGGGTWEKIPCFIIKGVCDYSDSHKNKVWQPYAAATAACCLKAFLVPWRESVNMNKIHIRRNSGHQILEFIQKFFVLDPPTSKSQIKLDNGDPLPGTGSWLFNPPLSTSEEAETTLQDLQEPYCTFNKWWTGDQSQVLWIRGNPGKGKTMLAISIIDELDQRLKAIDKQGSGKHLLAYFFCVHQDEERSHAACVVRSLLWQVLSEFPELALPLFRKYEKQKGEHLFLTSLSALYLLFSALEEAFVDPKLCVYFVVDALDECSEASRNILLTYLRRIDNFTQERSKIKWLITVRNNVELWDGALTVSLEDSRLFVDESVNQYVSKKVQELALDKHYGDKLRSSVEKHLRQASNGTFLWISLACKELANSKVKSVNTMKTLSELPRGLVPLYRRILDQVLDNEDSPELVIYAISVLQVVLIAFRPLTLEELAIAADLPGDHGGPDCWAQDCVDLCGSFLNIRKATGQVVLVHQSVKDYLMPRYCTLQEDRNIPWMYCRNQGKCRCSSKCLTPRMYPSKDKYPDEDIYPKSTSGLTFPVEASKLHAAMVDRCSDYLASRVFPWVFEGSTQVIREMDSQFFKSNLPMAIYATLYWILHGRAASIELGPAFSDIKMLNKFLLNWLKSFIYFKNWDWDIAFGGYRKDSIDYYLLQNNVLLISCYIGVPQLVDVVLRNKKNDVYDINLGLHYAAEGGYEAIARMLIRNKADVNFSSLFPKRTALHKAVEHEHEGMTRLLIQSGADINLKDASGITPLHQAVDNVDVAIASLLIRNGALITILDDRGHTLLHLAAAGGLRGLNHLLILERGPCGGDRVKTDMDMRSFRGQGAWMERAEEQTRNRSYENMVKLLIEQQADLISVLDNKGFSPLHWAAAGDYELVVQLLIDSGADVNATDKDGWTSLQWVADKGMTAMTQRLLDNGGDPNLVDKFGRTALHWAANKGCDGTANLLLKRGANVNAIDSFSGATALHLAVHKCYKEMVLLLLENDADPNACYRTTKDTFRMDEKPYAEIRLKAMTILNMKYSDETQSSLTAGFPLHWANKEIAGLLLDNGAKPNVQESRFNLSPLAYATMNLYRQDVVELLLHEGANPNLTDTIGRTALFYAQGLKATEMLLKYGADVNAMDINSVTPLHLSAWYFETECVQLLLSKGANPLAKDRKGMTPLRRLELRMQVMEKRNLKPSRDDDSEKDSKIEAWKFEFEKIKKILEMSTKGEKP